jgi:MYXO-CTERM domain-containing protein
MKGLLGAAATFIVVASANAALSITSLGTGAPPATVGGLAMTPAIADPSAVFADVTSAPLTGTKSVLFSSPVSHRTVGSGWASWSHGYGGDVYFTNGGSTVTMTFNQTDLTAFYFYVEPDGFGLHDMSISAAGSGGASAATTASVDGLSGAAGFGISGTGGTTLTSITVTLTGGSSGFFDFAVGEFGWSKVPAPGALALLGIAGLCGRRRRA